MPTFFENLGRGKGSLLFEAPSLRDGRFTTRKIDSHLWPATLFQTHIFCGLRLSSRESKFLSKRAVRDPDEPSTTRKTLDHTFGQLRSQHFWSACCNTQRCQTCSIGSLGSLVGGFQGSGTGDPQLEYTHPLLPTRSL